MAEKELEPELVVCCVVVINVGFSMAGMCRGQNVGFSMDIMHVLWSTDGFIVAQMCHCQNVGFSMSGMCHGQSIGFSIAGMCRGQSIGFRMAEMYHGQNRWFLHG